MIKEKKERGISKKFQQFILRCVYKSLVRVGNTDKNNKNVTDNDFCKNNIMTDNISDNDFCKNNINKNRKMENHHCVMRIFGHSRGVNLQEEEDNLQAAVGAFIKDLDILPSVYRHGFPEVDGWTSDVGWGCLMRVMQMIGLETIKRNAMSKREHDTSSPTTTTSSTQEEMRMDADGYEKSQPRWTMMKRRILDIPGRKGGLSVHNMIGPFTPAGKHWQPTPACHSLARCISQHYDIDTFVGSTTYSTHSSSSSSCSLFLIPTMFLNTISESSSAPSSMIETISRCFSSLLQRSTTMTPPPTTTNTTNTSSSTDQTVHFDNDDAADKNHTRKIITSLLTDIEESASVGIVVGFGTRAVWIIGTITSDLTSHVDDDDDDTNGYFIILDPHLQILSFEEQSSSLPCRLMSFAEFSQQSLSSSIILSYTVTKREMINSIFEKLQQHNSVHVSEPIALCERKAEIPSFQIETYNNDDDDNEFQLV